MTFKIEEILEFLAQDEGRYSLQEISATLNIPISLCKKITDFLVKYKFVQRRNAKIKINPTIREFIISTSTKGVIQVSLHQ